MHDGQEEVQELLPSHGIASDKSFAYSSITKIIAALLRFFRVFFKVLLLAFRWGASYTFSFNVLLVQILAGYLDEANYDKSAILGAAALISSLLNSLSLLATGQIYSISIYTGKKQGRIKLLIERREQETDSEIDAELDELKSIISTVVRNGALTSVVMLPVTMIIMYRSRDCLILLGQNPEIAAIVQTYTRPGDGYLTAISAANVF